ncbi:hypothetical protein GCM10022252_11720 [Streptosporangium oxazolinicum]|uniref:Uncharacterized protein n=1 Tax=Streptosporangium oxazolinicum TaxID=909287 RepID=A0ABP8AHB8_9ACTN
MIHQNRGNQHAASHAQACDKPKRNVVLLRVTHTRPGGGPPPSTPGCVTASPRRRRTMENTSRPADNGERDDPPRAAPEGAAAMDRIVPDTTEEASWLSRSRGPPQAGESPSAGVNRGALTCFLLVWAILGSNQ